MNPTIKKGILLGILFACIIIVFKIIKRSKSSLKVNVTPKDDCEMIEVTKKLYYGSTGCEVKELQERINYTYKTNLVEDGILGDETTIALTKYGYQLPVKIEDFTDYYTV